MKSPSISPYLWPSAQRSARARGRNSACSPDRVYTCLRSWVLNTILLWLARSTQAIIGEGRDAMLVQRTSEKRNAIIVFCRPLRRSVRGEVEDFCMPLPVAEKSFDAVRLDRNSRLRLYPYL